MSRLYVVATPIGNLNDISPRARDALSECDLVAAEDTRVAMKLLNHLGISKAAVSCHRHNEDDRAPSLIRRMLDEDITVALTCDAGTPAISDPGSALVRAAWEAGVEVVPIPGPSAAITALSACGFDTREFAFFGFLPRENKPLREKLASIRRSGVGVAVVYESPHRVIRLMEAICAALPGCDVLVCCDLTKLYEKIDRGPCDEVLAVLRERPNVEKGEYCIVIDMTGLPPLPDEEKALPPEAEILHAMLSGMTLEDACAAAREKGAPRNEVYRARERVRAFLKAQLQNDPDDTERS